MTDTQDGPIQEGSGDASNDDRLAGIIEQVRTDAQMGHDHETVLQMLKERTGETGVEVDDERLRQIAQEITGSR